MGYKEKILHEIEKIPDGKLVNIYKVIHLWTEEFPIDAKKTEKRSSLKGIWKGSQINESLFSRAKKSLFPYEKNRST